MNLRLWKGKRRHSYYFDYDQVVERFMGDLERLAEHIRTHDYRTDAEEIGNEIDHALELFHKHYNSYRLDDELQTWNAAWDYIRDNMRKWWD